VRSKIEFVRVKIWLFLLLFAIFAPIFHSHNAFQWKGLSTTLTRPVDTLWRLIAQRMFLGGHYTGDIEKCYACNSHIF